MSSRRQENNTRRRTSERMRLKMLRNVDEFKIANPYRRHTEALPEDLGRQLKKIDFLSSTSINTLCMPPSTAQSHKWEVNLMKMSQAHQQQENKFQAIFGSSMLDLTEVEHQHYSHSQAPPTHPSNGQQNQEIKDQLHLQMYDDRSHLHQNLFQLRGLGMEELPLMECEQHQPWQPPQQPEPEVPLQDFEQYFIS